MAHHPFYGADQRPSPKVIRQLTKTVAKLTQKADDLTGDQLMGITRSLLEEFRENPYRFMVPALDTKKVRELFVSLRSEVGAKHREQRGE